MKNEKILFYRYENDTIGKNEFSIKEKKTGISKYHMLDKNWFLTKEEATAHFEESHKIALDRYEKVLWGIKKLKESLWDFSYNYFFLGDTYGIDDDGLYIEINVNGYDFQFPQEL